MEPNDVIEPLRRTQSAQATRPHPVVRNSSSFQSPPRLMLVNGRGEVSTMPSPIVDRMSDDETSSSSETDTPIQEHIGHVKSLSVPSIFDTPMKASGTRRDYSPTRRPASPPRRNLSPPKMVVAANEGKPRPNHRRGHHHKHSLSHQLFLPPPERPPLPLPAHLPVPTFGEILVQAKSASQHTLPLLVHSLAILYLIHTCTGEASFVALTFLALNDLLSSVVQIVSQAMTLFDVWRTPTLRLPFGLQRAETLADFALGVFGTFNGLYVLKETIEDIIIEFSHQEVSLDGSAGGHHHHHHYVEADIHRVSPGGIDVPVFLLFLTTVYLVSTIRPHARTSRLLGLRVDYLTLISTFVLFMIPLVGIPPLHAIDRSISLIIAFTMISLGLRTGKIWGSVLLCIPSKDDKHLIKQISSAPGIIGVEKHRLFQSTHRSGQAIFNIRVIGGEEIEKTIREHIGRCITDWDKDVKWEIFVEFER